MSEPINFGSGNAGGHPGFATYARADTFAALAQPAIVEDAGGWYHFDPGWAALPADVVSIAWTALIDPADPFSTEIGGVVVRDGAEDLLADDPEPVNMGSANAGGAPVFSLYARGDTFAALPQPVLHEGAGGWYYFDPDWDTVPTDVDSIVWTVTLNGAETPGIAIRRVRFGSGLTAMAGAMNLAELRAAVRDAVLERVTDTGLIPSDASLDRYINAANRAIFKEAVARNPRPWMERSADVAYAAPLLFSTLAGSGAPLRSIHLVRVATAGGYAPVLPMEEGSIDFADVEDAGYTPVVEQNVTTSRWYAEGQALYLTPPPAGAVVLRVSFVRAVGTMWNPTQHYALGGQLPDHHDLVVWKAAQLLYKKDEIVVTPWDSEVVNGLRALQKELTRNQGQRTRRIRRSSHFPNTRRR